MFLAHLSCTQNDVSNWKLLLSDQYCRDGDIPVLNYLYVFTTDLQIISRFKMPYGLLSPPRMSIQSFFMHIMNQRRKILQILIKVVLTFLFPPREILTQFHWREHEGNGL